jgi:hypothetical protein
LCASTMNKKWFMASKFTNIWPSFNIIFPSCIWMMTIFLLVYRLQHITKEDFVADIIWFTLQHQQIFTHYHEGS